MTDQQPQPSAATPPPPGRRPTPDMDVNMQELMRLERQDLATAGITLTDQQARERVELTIALMRRYMTSAPWSPPPRPDRGLLGPHCSHHDDCAMDVCQDGYAWNPCRTPGCPICGGPPVQTPEHWAGSAVAQALMSEFDRARARAYLDAYPLMRRPADPPVIPDERQDAVCNWDTDDGQP